MWNWKETGKTEDQNRVFEGYEFKRWIGGDR